jgi:hypothetical protein
MATVTYATRLRDGHEWMAETFVPEGVDAAPIAILLPGESSDRFSDAFGDLGAALAERGVGAVLADHWPAPGPAMFRGGGAGFGEAVENVVCLVRSAGGPTGLESEGVVVFGQSAGGFDGLFATLAGDEAIAQWDRYASEHGGPGPQIECAGAEPFEVSGFVGYAGGYEAPWMLREANPALADFLIAAARVDGAPSVIRMIEGERDTTIPPSIAARHAELAEALRAAGHDVQRATVDDAHIPTTDSAGWRASLEAIVELARRPGA